MILPKANPFPQRSVKRTQTEEMGLGDLIFLC